ncbi:MAG TPA: sn-glycerol-3-phosphate ABC transporter ATP-binding protein UgpC [Geminicoccaceae bacterium]|nr:sn-glycerol-3-phosphate ABC transporter ATP-binding protein UgpC [Geminicoccus sp.]HMU51932.1 sn-glycerol-3-phosphate ABC transporter ATP-binding protein UgpC [Geminicoccaceae bacterium]
MGSLSVRGVTKTFGALTVLQDIELEAEDGEFIVLVGPSGCGKSTLLAMIAGLETVTAGEIRIAERVVNRVAPKDRNIAMVFQSYALYPTMTVRQNITFGMECRSIPKAEQDAAVERVAALLQIGHLLGRKPSQLSGGQRQRVAMGRALVRDPELFLFDEPLSNLDAKLRVEMRTEIKRLHQRLGTTAVYVTHDQVEAMTLASRIAVMHQGRIQQLADPRTVYDRPANLFVAGFMGSPAMNFIPARVLPGSAVRIGTERPVDLPLPPSDALGAWLNRDVVLGIRPENLSHHGRHGTQRPWMGELEARVEVVEPTGAETMVVIHIDGREVIARVEPDEATPVGSTMRFGVDMAKACLFDPATELLI